VLLLDGNIGIGGDPHRLLRRVRELLTPTGRLLVELDVDGVTAVGRRGSTTASAPAPPSPGPG
jgi:hypothetical protein